MNVTSFLCKSRTVALALTAVALLLTSACGSGAGTTDDGKTGVQDGYTVELAKLCDQVTARTVNGPAGSDMVVVQDGSRSVLPAPAPDEYAAQISELSEADGGLTLIGANGAGTAPTTVLLDAALSTPGPRDRPSVAKLADLMPTCVDQGFRTPYTSSGTGTDLYRALFAAAEVTSATTHLWTFTDMVSNTGQLALTPELLALEPDTAARRAAEAAPLDLHGATWQVVGVANTAPALEPAPRAWLLAFTQELCRAWHAAGCQAIALTPTTASGPAHPGAPQDSAPVFPSVSITETSTSCTFSVPSSVSFESDSAVLLPGAESALRGPLDLLGSSPEADARVVGHTASTDLASEGESGVQLSRERAEAVAAVLETVAPGRVEAFGVGDSQPLGEDLNPSTGEQIDAAAARERRVDVNVSGTGCA